MLADPGSSLPRVFNQWFTCKEFLLPSFLLHCADSICIAAPPWKELCNLAPHLWFNFHYNCNIYALGTTNAWRHEAHLEKEGINNCNSTLIAFKFPSFFRYGWLQTISSIVGLLYTVLFPHHFYIGGLLYFIVSTEWLHFFFFGTGDYKL